MKDFIKFRESGTGHESNAIASPVYEYLKAFV